MTELLQPIRSTAGLYAADVTGQIWRVKGHRARKNRKLKASLHPNGYMFVGLSIGNMLFNCSVHRLVAEAFHGPIPEGLDVCHANHVRNDNRPENLHFGTRSENCQESAREGRYGWHRKGVKPATTKLKEHQYLEIVARYACGAYQEDIAKEYEVTQGLVSKIIRTRFPR